MTAASVQAPPAARRPPHLATTSVQAPPAPRCPPHLATTAVRSLPAGRAPLPSACSRGPTDVPIRLQRLAFHGPFGQIGSAGFRPPSTASNRPEPPAAGSQRQPSAARVTGPGSDVEVRAHSEPTWSAAPPLPVSCTGFGLTADQVVSARALSGGNPGPSGRADRDRSRGTGPEVSPRPPTGPRRDRPAPAGYRSATDWAASPS